MPIIIVVPNGTRMNLTASISIVVSGPFIQGRGSKCRLGNNQLKIIQTDKQICITHRNDIKPPRSTILLLSLILLMRRLMSRWTERSVIPLRSTSFVLRYSSRHNGHISHGSKIDLYAQPCGSKPDNPFVKEILNLIFQGHTVLCIMTGCPRMEITPSHHIVLE